MNEKEKQKIKEYYINTVHPDEKSRNEFIEFINAMPEESAPEYFKPSETMNRMRCTCTPANVNVGREWTIDLDCPRHKHLASQIAKGKIKEGKKVHENMNEWVYFDFVEKWLDQGGE